MFSIYINQYSALVSLLFIKCQEKKKKHSEKKISLQLQTSLYD